MARPVKYKTPTARKKAQKVWNKQVTVDRNKRYNSDAGYAQTIKDQRRKDYQEAKGLVPVEIKNCAEFLPMLKSNGTVRTLDTGDSLLTFNVRQTAVVMGGYHPNVVYRWIRLGKFPSPPLMVAGRKVERVFNEPQIRALVKVFSEHQKVKLYFNDADVDTINALHKAVEDAL